VPVSLQPATPIRGGRRNERRAENKGSSKKKGKHNSRQTKRPKEEQRSSADTIRAYMVLAKSLGEATKAASALVGAGKLGSDAAKIVDREIDAIEQDLEGLLEDRDELDQNFNWDNDLRSTINVVRRKLHPDNNELPFELPAASSRQAGFADPQYWDDLYHKRSADDRFDWYANWDEQVMLPDGRWEQFGNLLRPLLERDAKQILMLGCGNSDLTAKMHREGYRDIVNIDISKHLIKGLRAQYMKEMPKMQWLVMSVASLKFDDAAFDVVVEKGTLDAIDRDSDVQKAAIREAHRTLKPGGVFISITFKNEVRRVEGQLKELAKWATCRTQAFVKAADVLRPDRTSYYVHACSKL